MMPRRKRGSSPMEFFEDDFDEGNSSQGGNPPIQRNTANARERARMRVLSSAFGRLKTKLPNIPPDTKLSKLDTLRLATIYIKQLKTIVDGGEHDMTSNEELINETLGNSPTHSSCLSVYNASGNMSWPFGFYHLQHQHSQYKNHSTSCNNTVLHSTPTWFTTTTSLRSPANVNNNATAINQKCSPNQLKIQSNLKNSQHSWYSARSDPSSPEMEQYTKTIEVQNEKYYHQQSGQQQQYSQCQHHDTSLTQSWYSSHELQHRHQLQQQLQQHQCYSQQDNRSQQQQRPPYVATFSNLSNLTNTGLK